ncbi:MAG: methyltransferase domain-containing protein [Thermoleophilaceae bacterium]
MLGDDLLERLGARVPGDHARQVAAERLVEDWHPRLRRGGEGLRVVDLGCGSGHSVDFFRGLDPAARWTGVDLPQSPEVATRVRTDAEFLTFDGVSIPLEDGAADLVFCKQVLEHVEQPAPLLAEVARVLGPGGHLVGSTSQLEPYHSLSQFNYTPVGLARLFEEAGLETLELRPGIDALTLIVRRGLGSPALFLRWWARESPLNRAIDLFARARRLETRQANGLKLMFCGQFGFVARRPDVT